MILGAHTSLSPRDAARLFAGKGSGFTGGDGAYSVPLPDGRTAWSFGDSFIGGVQPDGTRSHDTGTFVRNSVVITDPGGRPNQTLTQGTRGRHFDFAAPPGAKPNKGGTGPDPWYWPGDGVARGSRLQLLMSRMAPGVEDPWWGWKNIGTDLVTVDTRDMKVRSILPTNSGSRVSWGAAILDSGPWTYIYGAEGVDRKKYAHVARVPDGDLSRPWSFWNGADWVADHAASKRLPVEVASQFSVVQAKEGVRLVTQQGLDDRLYASSAPSPEGPWGAAQVVGQLPRLPQGSYAYNPVVHEHLSRGDKLLVSYNVASPAFMVDHTVYRPHFTEIDRAAVEGLAPQGAGRGSGLPRSSLKR